MAGARWRDGWWSAARPLPSPNHGPRPDGAAVTLAVVHSISLPPGEYGGDAIERLFTNRLDPAAHPAFAPLQGLRVSAHFVIRRDGECVQYVSCDRRAWHAGVSTWRGRDNCNDWSVGIELEGLEGEVFEAVQYARLAQLLRALAARYPIAEAVGHEHVAPGRKGDPGAGFDWLLLRGVLRRRRPALPFAPRDARHGARG
jgi:AmpD protein